MADSVIRTPLSPALSSAPSGTPPSDIDSPRQLVSPGAGRQRSVSLIEAEEKRERLREKERADAHSGNGVEGDERADGKISAIELRAEMETLLSLRRRSISQPDPDLPPMTSPSQPPPSLIISSSSSSPILSPISSSSSGQRSPTFSSPGSPTAPETGTLIRRVSTSSQRLPSDHPLPLSPHESPPLSSPYSPTNDGATAAHSSQDLFWLPASLHPELAPQEFKAFIREQTRPDNLARRVSASGSGVRIDRKKSMLRGEYKPRTDDGVGEQSINAGDQARRTKSSGSSRKSGRSNFDDLTIRDLQLLEELAARAEAEGATDGEGEGERLGRVLRRSLSLNPNHVAAAAAAGTNLAGFPFEASVDSNVDIPLSPDSPLIIPGQILRRSARTKIRKVGLAGDGGGHRFGPSRRGRGSSAGESDRLADDADSVGDVSIESGEYEGDTTTTAKRDALELEVLRHSPTSDSSTEVQITPIEGPLQIESHSPVLARDQSLPPAIPSGLPDTASLSTPRDSPPPSPSAIDPSSADWLPHQQNQAHQPLKLDSVYETIPSSPTLAPRYHQPDAQKQQQLQQSEEQQPEQRQYSQQTPNRSVSAPTLLAPVSSTSHLSSRPVSNKEGKEKKSGWARLGLSGRSAVSTEDDEKRKSQKAATQVNGEREKEKEYRDREKEKENQKESAGFFGGLFGRRKSDQELSAQQAAATLSPPVVDLRMVQAPSPTASGAMGPSGRYTNFYRLPIHVERAVYRLSHIKLANPRRPLYEQVLISNLMFWYLSIINKPVIPVPTIVPVPAPISHLPERSSSVSNQYGKEDDDQGYNRGSGAGQTWESNDRSNERNGQSNDKRPGLNKDGRRGPGRSASSETPIRQPEYGEQGQSLRNEQQQQQHSSRQYSRSASTPSYSSNCPPSPPRSLTISTGNSDPYYSNSNKTTFQTSPSSYSFDSSDPSPQPSSQPRSMSYPIPPSQRSDPGHHHRRRSSEAGFDEFIAAYSSNTDPGSRRRSKEMEGMNNRRHSPSPPPPVRPGLGRRESSNVMPNGNSYV